MLVELKDSNCFGNIKDILIKDDKKTLKIFYGANGDLYFDIFGCRNKEKNGSYTATFSIPSNEEIYPYFEQMVNNIINCKVYDMSDMELAFCDFNQDIPNKINSIQQANENLKTKQSYKKLVHNDMVIWYSDNIYDERANVLQINRNCEEIKLTFIDNPDDPSFGFGIRICNSGSKYDPFNICFMNLFNQLQVFTKKISSKKLAKTKNSYK